MDYLRYLHKHFALLPFNLHKLTEILSGSNTRKYSEPLSYQNLETSRISDLSASAIAYNTSTHDGLKSHGLLSPSHTEASHLEYYSQTRPASDIHLSSASNHLTVTRKPLSGSDCKSTAKQLSTQEEITLPTIKSGTLANLSSADESAATLQLVSNSTSSSIDGKTVALSPDGKLVTLKSQDKTA